MADNIVADQLAFLLFGDQSLDTHGFLADLYRRGPQGVLAKAFLAQSCESLRKEIEGLPKLEREKLPKFQYLQQLNQRFHAQTIKHPGVSSALCCITQLAHYIEYVIASGPRTPAESHTRTNCSRSYAESHFEDVTDHGRMCLTGLCTGQFAAAAIASTPSLSTLVPVAVAAVLLAFRTGRHVGTFADRIYQSSDSTESWTYIAYNVSIKEAQSILADFHHTNVSVISS